MNSAEITTAPSSHRRIPELDGLRGIAILLVMLFHFSPHTGPMAFFADAMQTGWIGVDLFFVLSGFLITGILLDSKESPRGQRHYYRNFIVRRALRIFPLYYVCLVLYCILSWPLGEFHHWKEFLTTDHGWWFAAYLGNIKTTMLSGWPRITYLIPLWSLQVEEQFYFTYPLLIAFTSRRTLTRILVASVVVAFLFRFALTILFPKNLTGAYTLMPARMDTLAMGGLVAIGIRQNAPWLKHRLLPWATLLSALLFVVAAWPNRPIPWAWPWSMVMQTMGYSAIGVAFTGILILLVVWKQRVLMAICRSRALMALGTIAYGLYMLHIAAAELARSYLEPKLGIKTLSSSDTIVVFFAAILLASVSWFVFESPILRLKDRWTK